MEELFALSRQDTVELLNIIKPSTFNDQRAVYWPCTRDLLKSNIYMKIEKSVEDHLGRQVYFVFDYFLTPSSSENFHMWHKDVEDISFGGGCRNIWIPLYSSNNNGIAGLEIIQDEKINQDYDDVLPPDSPILPLKYENRIEDDECVFVNQSTMNTMVVKQSSIAIERPIVQLNHVYILDSGKFHRGVKTCGLDVRFGVKFSTNQLASARNHAYDIAIYAFVHSVLNNTSDGFANIPYKQRCYAVGNYIHENLSYRENKSNNKYIVLYSSLIELLLQKL